MISDQALRWLHAGAGSGHLVQAIMGWTLVNTVYKDNGFFFLHNPVASSPNSPNTTLNENFISQYQLTQLVPAFSLLSTFNHFWAVFDFKRYLSFVDEGYNPVRWAEFAASAGISTWAIGQTSGITNVRELTAILIINAAMQFSGYSIEKDVGRSLKSSGKEAEHLFSSAVRQEIMGFGMFAAILTMIWIAFFTSIENVNDEEDGDVPSFVYAIVIILSFLYLTFGIVSVAYVNGANPKNKSKKSNFWKLRDSNFRNIELYYIVLSFVSKSLLLNLILFGAINSREPGDSKNQN